MADKIPEGITREHILRAIDALNFGAKHDFADSTGYDLPVRLAHLAHTLRVPCVTDKTQNSRIYWRPDQDSNLEPAP